MDNSRLSDHRRRPHPMHGSPPAEGLERRMHPDANTMAGLWAQMLVDRVDTVPGARISPDVMAAERWRASDDFSGEKDARPKKCQLPLRLTRDIASPRSVAEGFPVASSAQRYLDCSEDSAVAVHPRGPWFTHSRRRHLDARALGPRWRLLRACNSCRSSASKAVSLEEWAESNAMTGFPLKELRDLRGRERPLGTDRKTKQIERLRRLRGWNCCSSWRLTLSSRPLSDSVAAWFPKTTAVRLKRWLP